ncbi:MAG TPA: hypothetical protein VM487_00360 [Phycisphaerae bacterium]|nr:hypothetical protein [Phycisphaerae bacterium]
MPRVRSRRLGAPAAGGGADGTGPVTALSVDLDQVGTDADTAEKDLLTFVLPANTLATDGDAVRIRGYVLCAGNANVKEAKMHFGATELISSTAIAYNGQAFSFDAMVYRTGVGTQFAYGKFLRSLGAVLGKRTTPTDDETGTITIRLTGQNGTASANDIVSDGLIVDKIAAPA